ncbi:Tyrosine-protein kinase Wzc [Candidatus Paraburkholderia calva]|nr:Tyrosine-protein kinase Wzc [Candidatus Paraburkholderia calva]
MAPHTVPVIDGLLDAIGYKLESGLYANGSDLLKVDRIDVPVALQDERLTLEVVGPNAYVLKNAAGTTLLSGTTGQAVNANGVGILVSRLDAHPGATFNVVRFSRSSALGMLLSRIMIGERGKNTGVLQVSVSGTNATVITDEANAIVDSYMRLRTARSGRSGPHAVVPATRTADPARQSASQ